MHAQLALFAQSDLRHSVYCIYRLYALSWVWGTYNSNKLNIFTETKKRRPNFVDIWTEEALLGTIALLGVGRRSLLISGEQGNGYPAHLGGLQFMA